MPKIWWRLASQRPVERIALPRSYLRGIPQAYKMSLVLRRFSMDMRRFNAQMQEVNRQVRAVEQYELFDDLLASTRPLTRRERLYYWAWETWYLVKERAIDAGHRLADLIERTPLVVSALAMWALILGIGILFALLAH